MSSSLSSSSSLPRLTPATTLTLKPEPLTPQTFAPFGTAILPPFGQHLTTIPVHPPRPQHPHHQPNPQPANQHTALKTSPISPLTNNYPPPTRSQNESHGQMSIFSCFPRRNTHIDRDTKTLRLKLEILERHPYTTQTFCPFNFSSSTSSSPSSSSSSLRSQQTIDKTYFLVTVAPTIQDPFATPPNPPDLTRLRAFVAPVTIDGGGLGVAVTYSPGTWHAPMVVLGTRRVDFLVSQFVNGVSEDDCQECLVGEEWTSTADGKGKVVEVDLGGLGLGGSDGGLWKAKL